MRYNQGTTTLIRRLELARRFFQRSIIGLEKEITSTLTGMFTFTLMMYYIALACHTPHISGNSVPDT